MLAIPALQNTCFFLTQHCHLNLFLHGKFYPIFQDLVRVRETRSHQCKFGHLINIQAIKFKIRIELDNLKK